MHYQYLKQTIRDNQINIQHTSSTQLHTGIFNKALKRRQLETLGDMIAVKEIPNIEQDIIQLQTDDCPSSGGVLEHNSRATLYESIPKV